MGRASSTNGGDVECIRTLVGKPEEMRPLGRLRRRWVDNIKIHLREIECTGSPSGPSACDNKHYPAVCVVCSCDR
jgi:hypothetical protein